MSYLIASYILDVWSIGHFALWFAFGIVMGLGVPYLAWKPVWVPDQVSAGQRPNDMWAEQLGWKSWKIKSAFLAGFVGLAIGIEWELVEGAIVEPLAGWHEPWANRWLADLLLDTAGTLVGWRLACHTKN